MGELVLYIALIILLPILLLMIFLEKRARRVMMSFLCGVLVCLTAYFVNTLAYRGGHLSSGDYSKMLAPVVEEILKFIPLLIFSVVLKKGKRQTIAISFALGVGFCVVENFFYLFNNVHNASVVWVILRCIGTGLMHAMSTTLIGFGLYEARVNAKRTVFVSVVALLIAMFYHGLYNSLVSIQEVQIIGIFIPILSYIGLSFFLKKDAIKAFFEDEDEDENKDSKKAEE